MAAIQERRRRVHLWDAYGVWLDNSELQGALTESSIRRDL
jgi:hypothetical protein